MAIERTIRVPVGGLREAILRDVERAMRRAALRIKERGIEIMRAEVPVRDGGLKAGVSGSVSRQNPPTISLIASAIARRVAGTAVAVSASGKRRRVSLRAGRPFDYAEAVAEGTGLFGKTGQRIRPKRARALLIEVDSPPEGEGYLIVGKRFFVYRASSAGMKPNDYPARTIVRLEPEIDAILAAEMAKL